MAIMGALLMKQYLQDTHLVGLCPELCNLSVSTCRIRATARLLANGLNRLLHPCLQKKKQLQKKHLCPGNGECGEGGEGRWAGGGVGEGREAMHTIIVLGSRVVSIGTDVHTSIRTRSHPGVVLRGYRVWFERIPQFFLLRLREVYPWSWNSEFLLWSSRNRVVRKDPIHIGVDMFVKELRLSTSFCPL